MKRGVLLTIAFVLATFTLLTAQGGVQFERGSLDAARNLARMDGRLVFIDAYASWCGPCKAMNRDVFPDPQVGDFFNANFVNMKIDMEKGNGPDVARGYNVNAYPTLLFIDASGKVIHRVEGYRDVDGLLREARTALSKAPQPVVVAPPTPAPNPAPAPVITPQPAPHQGHHHTGPNCACMNRAAALRQKMEQAKCQGNWCAYACAAEELISITPNPDWTLLNDIAWEFYLHVDNLDHLRNGVRFARQSTRLNRNYYNLDTQAMLLWKLGRTDKAIWLAEEAIRIADCSGINAWETRMALYQMRGGSYCGM